MASRGHVSGYFLPGGLVVPRRYRAPPVRPAVGRGKRRNVRKGKRGRERKEKGRRRSQTREEARRAAEERSTLCVSFVAGFRLQ